LSNNYFFTKTKEVESDELQFKAYNAMGNTVVTAGPGSGKTTVLTLKVIKLLNQNIYQPRGLACLTYCREAAREFQNRLNLLGYQKRNNVFLGTVHSFCLSEILIPFSKLYPKYKVPTPIKIISTKEKNALFKEVNNKIGFKGLKLEEMEKERARDINGLSNVKIPSYDAALKVALLFEEKLFKSGYIDYTTLVKEATKMIQQEEYIQQILEAKFPWFVIDEYQDLGKSLHEMVLGILQKTNIKIFAVGDADQSIYDFHGASPAYLNELKNSDLIDEQIHLLNNYRSAKKIIAASELVLNATRNYVAKGKFSNYDAKIEGYICEGGMEEQYAKTVDLINDLYTKGIPYHKIAVLAGQNNHLKKLSEVCLENQIPYYIAKHEFERSDFVKWLENCISWLIDPMHTSFDDIYQYWEFVLKNHSTVIPINERIFYKRKLYDTLLICKSSTSSLVNCLECLLDMLTIPTILHASKSYPDEIENLDKLIAFFKRTPYNKYTVEQFASMASPINQVILSTRHGSKGLEFDIVIMLGMEEGSFPYYLSKSQAEIDEAHRICFVCVSRARKKCILLRSKNLNILKKNGEIWCKPCSPSRFWNILFANK